MSDYDLGLRLTTWDHQKPLLATKQNMVICHGLPWYTTMKYHGCHCHLTIIFTWRLLFVGSLILAYTLVYISNTRPPKMQNENKDKTVCVGTDWSWVGL